MQRGESGGGGTRSDSTGANDGPDLGRRECLKLVGAAAVSVTGVAVESDVVRAASSGYGEGSHGEGWYGGDGFGVSTGDAANVGTGSATLKGDLTDLDGADSADCGFEWRPSGTSSWNATSGQTLSSTGSYARSLSGLSDGTDYEYRAVAEGSDGDTATGSTATFTTDAESTTSTGSTAPAIDSYSVTEAGSPNPHADITARWSVSDADGDLNAVVVDVVDSSGSSVDSVTAPVSGSGASGTETFEVKHASNRTFDVTLTVTDARNNSHSRTRTVTE